jgi:hypothetical protein
MTEPVTKKEESAEKHAEVNAAKKIPSIKNMKNYDPKLEKEEDDDEKGEDKDEDDEGSQA